MPIISTLGSPVVVLLNSMENLSKCHRITTTSNSTKTWPSQLNHNILNVNIRWFLVISLQLIQKTLMPLIVQSDSLQKSQLIIQFPVQGGNLNLRGRTHLKLPDRSVEGSYFDYNYVVILTAQVLRNFSLSLPINYNYLCVKCIISQVYGNLCLIC